MPSSNDTSLFIVVNLISTPFHAWLGGVILFCSHSFHGVCFTDTPDLMAVNGVCLQDWLFYWGLPYCTCVSVSATVTTACI